MGKKENLKQNWTRRILSVCSEGWVRCKRYMRWAHEECTDHGDLNDYICDLYMEETRVNCIIKPKVQFGKLVVVQNWKPVSKIGLLSD